MTAYAPTSRQVLATNPGYTDKETVAAVQRALLAKGFPDGGPVDGVIGDVTRDEILAFRQRNNLPLVPIIDDELLAAIEVAPPRAMSFSQVTATPKVLATKVEVVAIAQATQTTAWYAKLWAAISGAPALLLAILSFAIDYIDEATAAITPLRNLFYDATFIKPQWWLAVIGVFAVIMGLQAWHIARLSARTVDVAVERYKQGTIKNDLPTAQEA